MKDIIINLVGDLMDINVVLEYFDKLNDEQAMILEFKYGRQILVDNRDIIQCDGDLIVIKSEAGNYITEYKNIMGIKTCNRIDIENAVLSEIFEKMGDL